ncbi:MAG TPA: hypothetical protein VJ742_12805 [Nitrososphaera sp.]|nr:hypothetical protein [Nitrososphaera sp.]
MLFYKSSRKIFVFDVRDRVNGKGFKFTVVLFHELDDSWERWRTMITSLIGDL